MASTPGTRDRAAKAGLPALLDKVTKFKPVRVFQRYASKRGPLLSAGLSYQSIFAVFAGIWVGFSVAGLLLQSQPELRRAFFDLLNSYIPGLISSGSNKGIIDPRVLLMPRTLSWTGAIALVGLLFTALGWLASCRDAVRAIFDLPGEKLNFLLVKLKDLGLGLGLGVALIVSAALSLASTQALGFVFGLLGVSDSSLVAVLLGRGIGLFLMLILDTAVLAALFRLLSGLAIPLRQLFFGSLLGAVALGVLKVLGSSLLGGASKNPLLVSFAVIIGLLIWFNLICQVILLSGAWIAVTVSDDGTDLDPKATRTREEKERTELARAVEEKVTAQQAAAQKQPWLVRLFRRRSNRRNDGGRP